MTEHRQAVAVTGTTVNFTITIDPAGRITDYNLTEPDYRELEVRDEDSGYYARFFLEVM